jgi:hypothetical protein
VQRHLETLRNLAREVEGYNIRGIGGDNNDNVGKDGNDGDDGDDGDGGDDEDGGGGSGSDSDSEDDDAFEDDSSKVVEAQDNQRVLPQLNTALPLL